MGTVHNEAELNDIAKNVIMPGDPLRAKYIAEKFLENPKLVNKVRNMFAYTGTYKGKEITVMGHGMGMPSASLYAYELYHFYDVDNIIRIGSCGAGNNTVNVSDVILSTGCYTQSNFAYSWGGFNDTYLKTSNELNEKIKMAANEANMMIHEGPTFTSDIFDVYSDIDHLLARVPEKENLLGIEMEGFGLLHVARLTNKNASVLMTVVDSKYTPDIVVSPEERETALDNMIKLALDSIIK